jgi:hypothetical protein
MSKAETLKVKPAEPAPETKRDHLAEMVAWLGGDVEKAATEAARYQVAWPDGEVPGGAVRAYCDLVFPPDVVRRKIESYVAAHFKAGAQ